MAPTQDVAAPPVLSWALSHCQPWQEPPVPFHLGAGSHSLGHSSADAWGAIPPAWGPWLPSAPSATLHPPCPTQLWGQQDPRVRIQPILATHSCAEPEPDVCSCSQGTWLPQILAVVGPALHHAGTMRTSRMGSVSGRGTGPSLGTPRGRCHLHPIPLHARFDNAALVPHYFRPG